MGKIHRKLVGAMAILSLIAGAFSPLGVSAHYLDKKGRSWYTVSELLDYKEEVDMETEQKCGDDTYCKEELYFFRMESEDLKYQALSQLIQQQFVLTAVNPGAETIKVLFFGEDAMLKTMGISEKLTLSELYIGWFDYEIERIFNYGSYPDQLLTDTMPGAHLIYGRRGTELYGEWTDEGPGEGIMADQEVEIYVPGAELVSNTSGRIAYAAFAEPYFNAMGTFDYSSCLLEEDYTEGAECQLMFSAEESSRYFPSRETVLLAEEDELVIASLAEADESMREKEFLSQSIKSAELKAPNTGAAPIKERQIEFPWWLILLIGLGVMAILWVLWPKSPKTAKKVLDKKSRLR